MFTMILYGMAGVALLVSWLKSPAKTQKALGIAWRSFSRILPNILGVIALIGLSLVLLPPGIIGRLFGNNSLMGLLVISMVGAITLMPGFIAFPLAATMLAQGAGTIPIMAFVTTLMMVGVLTAPMETQYFGRRWTLWRNCLSFIFAIIIGVIAGGMLR